MTDSRDAIGMAIIAGRLANVVDEMAVVLRNTARSNRISVRRQFGVALLDPACAVVATDNPGFLGTLEQSVATCINEFAFDLASDDVLFTNDPYGGAPSVHYFTLVKPITDGQDVLGYVAAQAHMNDIGGMVIGNYDLQAQEVRTEGVRFTPMRLVRFGRVRRDLFDSLVMNSRDPERFAGDLRAILAALDVGARAVQRHVSTYGAAAVKRALQTTLEHSERSLRQGLSAIPEGSYEGTATLATDGHGRESLNVRVKLTRTGTRTTLDFTGTDVQSKGFVNSQPAMTRTAAILRLLGVLNAQVQFNSGLLRAIEFILPEGSLVSPTYPAPTGWSTEHVALEIGEAVRQAMIGALPEAAGPGYASRNFAILVQRQMRVGLTIEQIATTDLAAFAQPGSSAGYGVDGWGLPGASSLGEAPSVEEFEAASSFAIRSMEYDADSAGAGRWRGGPGVTTRIAIPANGQQLYALTVNDREGVAGADRGEKGSAGSLRLIGTNQQAEVIRGAVIGRPLEQSVEIEIKATGGAGFGDPTLRDRAALTDDVRNGYVSATTARNVYKLQHAREVQS